MNNIISKVAASILLAGIAISSVNATSKLVTDGNDTNEWYKTAGVADGNFAIDIKGDSTDANLTFIPNINAAPGSGFTLKFENGGYVEQSSIYLCADDEGNISRGDSNLTVVGNMFSKGTVVSEVMSDPKFQFADVNESLIKDGSHIFFRTDQECKKLPEIVGLGDSCKTLTAQIVDGVTKQSTKFPDYDTNIRTLGKTKKMIRVACSAPICLIDATEDMKKFTNIAKSSGINGQVSSASDSDLKKTDRTNDTAVVDSCPECAETTKCVTYIEIGDASSKHVQGLKLALDFYDKDGVKNNDVLKLKSTVIELDGNKTVDYVVNGKTVTLSGLDLDDSNKTIKVSFTPNESDILPEGFIQARVYDLDTNTTKNGIDVTYDENKKFASFKVSGKTEFTVPYMNGSISSMVRISAPSNADETKVSAVITDTKGNTCEVTLDAVPAKGATMIFAKTKAGRAAPYQNLIEAGECTDLESKEYSVRFTTSSTVDVVSYMTMSNGSQRYVDVY